MEASCEWVGIRTVDYALVNMHLDSRLFTPHIAASLVYSLSFYCCPGMKEIEQDATVLGSYWPRLLS